MSIDDCIKKFLKAGDLYSLAKAKRLKASIYIALNKLDKAEKEIIETLVILKESPNIYFQAMTLLHLAYFETIRGLIEGSEEELKKAAGLTLTAYKVFKELKATSLIISAILLIIQAYLLKVVDLNMLLEYINGGIKGLNEGKAYVQARVLETIRDELKERIRENRDIDKEFLRLRGVKLLCVL